MPPSLEELIAALPEMYQPIFNHPELSGRAILKCEARLEHVLYIYRLLQAQLGRPLRVLDLGCAQGFFSFSLAQEGAEVHGLDCLQVNVSLCNALAAENSELKVSFLNKHIEDFIIHLKPDEYDLVLGLSIFHYTVQSYGLEAAQQIMGMLSKKVLVGIFELALAHEPFDWAAAQPKNPRVLLKSYSYTHALATNITQLSNIARPLFVSSNYYCFLDQHDESQRRRVIRYISGAGLDTTS